AETGGYQLLLNFYGTGQQFPIISLQDVLNDRATAELLRDRIVLIGYTAESVNDLFQTPYSSQGEKSRYMPGVVLHANIAQQLISGGVAGRTMRWVWPEPIEWLWIGLWTLAGGGISQWRLGKPWWWLPALFGLCLSGLLLGGYGLLLGGWWVPIVPCVIGFVGSGGLVISVSQRQLEKRKLQCTLQHLENDPTIDLPTRRVIFELLQQSESLENQPLIDRYQPLD
ncbi:MAG: CHASE2 domain-containing protein, partial [Alkalinema sp. RL_2_19]|nr:CHASE2 domain-containing protein [Alkalinema sp. RL_2_19]